MSRRSLAYLTAAALVLPVGVSSLSAQTNSSAMLVEDAPRYTANQIDNLVGPIALYPDALLAQVLVAATFPDQVEDAARYVRANGTNGIDDQSWDVSVKAVAHYASALNALADKLDWTTTLGTAYANQSSDVMASVQRMRALAAQQGNLVTNTQQQVIQQGPNYVITPAQPRVIYVPVYDPVVVYTRPIFGVGFSSRYWSYGVGFPIGGWLSYDLDWGMRRVYYNGWDAAYYEFGGGWRARSRPFISITNVYVSPRYRNVYVNRDVWRRPINYVNVDRFGGYHRDTYFAGRRDGYRDGYRDGRDNDRDNRDGGRVGGRDRDEVRTAQPRDNGGRDDRAVVTPDGYRRVAGSREDTPRDRRSEPSVSSNAVSVAPEYVRSGEPRTAERRSEERTDGSDRPERGDQPRIAMPQTPQIVAPPPAELPRATPRQAYPQDMPRRTSNPRDEVRQAPPREATPRAAQPRVSAPRESQPRESQPRVSAPRSGGGESRQASPRSANPRGGR